MVSICVSFFSWTFLFYSTIFKAEKKSQNVNKTLFNKQLFSSLQKYELKKKKN